jgi:crotonobetainyl-CoA:carnitine CoA-transferase CaiB-like acyl-CoA transferase
MEIINSSYSGSRLPQQEAQDRLVLGSRAARPEYTAAQPMASDPHSTSGLPLSGIRVIEVAQNLAGPFCAQILAHLGADVIKIERPEGGDDTRGWGPPFLDGEGSSFHAVNLGKRSVVVDLKDAAGVERLRRLVDGADVLVQNLRPGSMEALGLDSPALLERNPKLVYCSLHALGSVGPLKDRPGFEPMVQAYAGMMMMCGQPDGPPIRIGTQVLDHGTGMWAAIGVLAALARRSHTGRGGVVDTSLFETALGWWTIHHASYAVSGEVPPRHPTGTEKLIVFQGFEARNGPLVIAAGNDRLFAKLAVALGRADWAGDPRFAKNAGRYAHRAEILPEVARIVATRTKGEWIDILEAAGVPCAPVNTLPEALAEPQTEAVGMLMQVPGLDLRLMGLPIMLDGARPPIRRRAPKLGEHTGEVFGD